MGVSRRIAWNIKGMGGFDSNDIKMDCPSGHFHPDMAGTAGYWGIFAGRRPGIVVYGDDQLSIAYPSLVVSSMSLFTSSSLNLCMSFRADSCVGRRGRLELETPSTWSYNHKPRLGMIGERDRTTGTSKS